MACRLVGDQAAAQKFNFPTSGSQAITRGALVLCTYASDRVDPATSSVGTTLTNIGVAAETIASTATDIDVILLSDNQVWEIDCTSNTASNQVLNRHGMTDSVTVANTSSDTATTLGVWLMLAQVGAAADNKALFKPLLSGQVTA
jgi:hypothetical protein